MVLRVRVTASDAPGNDLLATVPGSRRRHTSCISNSCRHSGSLTLLPWPSNGSSGRRAVRSRMSMSATDSGEYLSCNLYGHASTRGGNRSERSSGKRTPQYTSQDQASSESKVRQREKAEGAVRTRLCSTFRCVVGRFLGNLARDECLVRPGLGVDGFTWLTSNPGTATCSSGAGNNS